MFDAMLKIGIEEHGVGVMIRRQFLSMLYTFSFIKNERKTQEKRMFRFVSEVLGRVYECICFNKYKQIVARREQK